MTNVNTLRNFGSAFPDTSNYQRRRTVRRESSDFEDDDPVSVELSVEKNPGNTLNGLNIPNNTPVTSNCTIDSSLFHEKKKYWKINFIIVCLPLIFWGIPIHLILFGKRGIRSTKQWFKAIFFEDHPIIIFCLTVPFLLYGLCINGFFFYLAYNLLYNLVGLGEIRGNIVEDLINILRTIPIVIPLDIVWVFGFSVRKLLLSFDRIVYLEIGKVMREGKNLKKPDKFWENLPNYRLWLAILYILIVLYEVFQLFWVMEEIKKANMNELDDSKRKGTILNLWVDFSLNLLYNLMIPIYAMFCFAIEFEFLMLSGYIKSLIKFGVHPDFKYFDEVKRYYKQVADHVIQINDMCSIYYSWVFIVLYLSMYNEVIGILAELLILIFGDVISDEVLAVQGSEVRLFVGNISAIIFQLVVISLTIWFGICANDQARFLHVRLNDFVTQPGVVMKPELYKAFRLLKNYIHSRMELEKPALLGVSIVSQFPSIQDWMVGYRVTH